MTAFLGPERWKATLALMAIVFGLAVWMLTKPSREKAPASSPRWMLVPVTREPTLTSGEPRLLFEGDYVHHAGRSYDVAPDGLRLLMIDRIAPSAMTELRIVRDRFVSRAGS